MTMFIAGVVITFEKNPQNNPNVVCYLNVFALVSKINPSVLCIHRSTHLVSYLIFSVAVLTKNKNTPFLVLTSVIGNLLGSVFT